MGRPCYVTLIWSQKEYAVDVCLWKIKFLWEESAVSWSCLFSIYCTLKKGIRYCPFPWYFPSVFFFLQIWHDSVIIDLLAYWFCFLLKFLIDCTSLVLFFFFCLSLLNNALVMSVCSLLLRILCSWLQWISTHSWVMLICTISISKNGAYQGYTGHIACFPFVDSSRLYLWISTGLNFIYFK